MSSAIVPKVVYITKNTPDSARVEPWLSRSKAHLEPTQSRHSLFFSRISLRGASLITQRTENVELKQQGKSHSEEITQSHSRTSEKQMKRSQSIFLLSAGSSNKNTGTIRDSSIFFTGENLQHKEKIYISKRKEQPAT